MLDPGHDPQPAQIIFVLQEASFNTARLSERHLQRQSTGFNMKGLQTGDPCQKLYATLVMWEARVGA